MRRSNRTFTTGESVDLSVVQEIAHVQLLAQNGASGLAQGSFRKMTLAHQNARCKYFDEENSTESRFYLMDPAKNCTIAHKLHTCTSAKTAPK